MATTIQLRGDTSANWTSADPILAEREMGIETDTLAYKIGDGVTAWSGLSYRELSGVFAAAMLLDNVANPSTPASGKLAFYSHSVGGRSMPKWKGSSGLDTPVQPAFFQNAIRQLSPSTTTVFNFIGISAPTVVGTASTPVIADGNFRTFQRRTIITSAGTANSASEIRAAYTILYIGETIGGVDVGGFFYYTRWAMSTAVANQRTAIGLWAATGATATTTQPSTLTNCVLMGNDLADTNYQIMHNDASGTCTKIDLGASFPIGNTSDVFDLSFFTPPNGSSITYRVINLRTNDEVSGVITTDLVPSTTMMTYHCYANNGGTASAVVLEIMKLYIESDY